MNERELRQLLDRYFNQKVQLRSKEKQKALQAWEPVVEKILKRVTEKDSRFDFRQLLYSGSYYERTKTKAPNEFDLMLEIQCLSLGKWEPYDADEDDLNTEPPTGFTTVMIDQGEETVWKKDGCMVNSLLSATKVKAVFSRLVCEAVRDLGLQTTVTVRTNGPSITLTILNYYIDLTLAIKDASWPDDAENWKRKQRNWPTQRLVTEIVQSGCHLVAKKPKGTSSRDADLFWRYSFSQAEKKLFTGGSTGEAGTCRRNVLRILKSLKEDLQMTPLTSYHLKTIMFYEYEAHPRDTDWLSDKLAARFKDALQRLRSCLQNRNCPHYFIPNLNLFESSSFNIDRYQFLLNRVDMLINNPSQVIPP